MTWRLVIGSAALAGGLLLAHAQGQPSFGGIGAVIGTEGGKFVIRSTLPLSPAAGAGFPNGSVIRSIDGVSTEEMKLADVVDRLRGPVGSKVYVEFIDPVGGDPITFPVTRQKISAIPSDGASSVREGLGSPSPPPGERGVRGQPRSAGGEKQLMADGKSQIAASRSPTFTKEIAPIVFQNCASCHRAGEVAPFSLLTYSDVSKRAKQIARVTREHIMPPWKAEKGFGEFLNERHLTAEQVTLLQEWFSAGAPEGNPADLPPLPKFPEGWTLGEPDAIVEPTEAYELGAEGRDVYRCFVIPTDFGETRYVSAIEVRPGNRRVVHHVIAHLDTTGKGRELDAKDPGPGYSTFGGVGFRSSGSIGGWAPGNFPSRLPDGLGIPLPKSADIILQVHYNKSGKAETDKTKVGIYFMKQPLKKRVRTLPVLKAPLRIPADDSNFVVHASLPVPLGATVYRVMPHMHLLGRDMKVTATLPDGSVLPLVHVPDWDFNWQTTYTFKEPLHLPAGSRVDLEARYDNSSNNPLNPHNPPRLVTWGEQTSDEMCIAFLTFTADAERPSNRVKPANNAN